MMKNNKLWLLLFLTLAVILFECGNNSINNNSNDEKEFVTFSLEKIDFNSFALTIDGADWSNSATDSALALLDFSHLKCKGYMYMDGTRVLKYDSMHVVPQYFTVNLTGKTITATIRSESKISGYSYSNLNGILSLTVESINNYMKKANVHNPVLANTIYAVQSDRGTITY